MSSRRNTNSQLPRLTADGAKGSPPALQLVRIELGAALGRS